MAKFYYQVEIDGDFCEGCPDFISHGGEGFDDDFCNGLSKDITWKKRPDNCPLIPVPAEKKNVVKYWPAILKSGGDLFMSLCIYPDDPTKINCLGFVRLAKEYPPILIEEKELWNT